MRRCTEQIYSEDSEGYSNVSECGGMVLEIGNTNLEQCNECKTVNEITV